MNHGERFVRASSKSLEIRGSEAVVDVMSVRSPLPSWKQMSEGFVCSLDDLDPTVQCVLIAKHR